MSAGNANATTAVTDFGQYAGLRAAAQHNDPKALRQAAQQFEALLTETLLKTSRQTKLGDDLTGAQGDFYNDLFDQQMALHLSAGKGLGLADMLVRQLGGTPAGVGTATGTGTGSAAEGAPEQSFGAGIVMVRREAEAAPVLVAVDCGIALRIAARADRPTCQNVRQ